MATLTDLVIAGAPGAWVLTASVREVDAFRVSQRPLIVVTSNGCRWTVQPDTLQMMAGTLTASLSPEE